jgi:hypothetical protein
MISRSRKRASGDKCGAEECADAIDDIPEQSRFDDDDRVRKLASNIRVATVDYEGDAAALKVCAHWTAIAVREPVVENSSRQTRVIRQLQSVLDCACRKHARSGIAEHSLDIERNQRFVLDDEE